MMQPHVVSEIAVALISEMGRSNFEGALAECLKRHLIIDAGLMLVYRKDERPRILFNDWQTGRGLADIKHYLAGAYRLDPFYQHAIENGQDGLFRLRHIAPGAFDRSRYYRDYYRHSGLMDEFNYIVSLDDTTKVAISLCRRRTHLEFSRDESELLGDVFPLLQTAAVRHWRDLRPETLVEDNHSLRMALAQALDRFGRSTLTQREWQVAQMVLRGNSLKGAAAKMGISPATVKLHRLNLYTKLDIGSQSELFALFLDSVSSADNTYEDPLVAYVGRRNALTGSALPD